MFPYMAHGLRMEPGISNPLCPPERRVVPRMAWRKQGLGITSPIIGAHADLPPPCPYRGKTGSAVWSVLQPPPLDTSGQEG